MKNSQPTADLQKLGFSADYSDVWSPEAGCSWHSCNTVTCGQKCCRRHIQPHLSKVQMTESYSCEVGSGYNFILILISSQSFCQWILEGFVRFFKIGSSISLNLACTQPLRLSGSSWLYDALQVSKENRIKAWCCFYWHDIGNPCI